MIAMETLHAINKDLNAYVIANLSVTVVEIINADINSNDVAHSTNTEKRMTNEKPEDIVKLNETIDSDSEPIAETNVNDTEQMKIHNQIISYYTVLGFLFGVDMRYDWKMTHHFNFWLTNFLLVMANSYIPYTLYYHISNGNYLRILEPLAMGGVCITSNLKWVVFIKYWQNLFSIIFHTKKLCRENITGARADAITAGLKKTCTVLKVFTVGVVAVLIFFVAVPVKYYIVDGILMTLLPFKTPFLDEDTVKGWLMATCIHAILGLYSGISTIVFGAGFLTCICNYNFLVELIGLDWTELNEMWNGDSDKITSISIAYRHAFLRNICRKFQDMKSYMEQVKEIYQLKFFFFLIVSYLGEVLCLYQIKASNWIPGYTIAGMVFIEMMFYCYVGTQLSIMDNQMCEFIQRTNWYLFDPYSQKMLQIMLHQCQRPNEIAFKSIGALNMVTGIQIVKGIYSYYAIATELF